MLQKESYYFVFGERKLTISQDWASLCLFCNTVNQIFGKLLHFFMHSNAIWRHWKFMRKNLYTMENNALVQWIQCHKMDHHRYLSHTRQIKILNGFNRTKKSIQMWDFLELSYFQFCTWSLHTSDQRIIWVRIWWLYLYWWRLKIFKYYRWFFTAYNSLIIW